MPFDVASYDAALTPDQRKQVLAAGSRMFSTFERINAVPNKGMTLMRNRGRERLAESLGCKPQGTKPITVRQAFRVFGTSIDMDLFLKNCPVWQQPVIKAVCNQVLAQAVGQALDALQEVPEGVLPFLRDLLTFQLEHGPENSEQISRDLERGMGTTDPSSSKVDSSGHGLHYACKALMWMGLSTSPASNRCEFWRVADAAAASYACSKEYEAFMLSEERFRHDEPPSHFDSPYRDQALAAQVDAFGKALSEMDASLPGLRKASKAAQAPAHS